MEYVRIYVSLIQHFGVSDASKENVGLPTDFHPTCILCIDCASIAPDMLQTMSWNVYTETSLTAEAWLCSFTICLGQHWPWLLSWKWSVTSYNRKTWECFEGLTDVGSVYMHILSKRWTTGHSAIWFKFRQNATSKCIFRPLTCKNSLWLAVCDT